MEYQNDPIDSAPQKPWVTYILLGMNLFVFFYFQVKGIQLENPLIALNYGANFAPYVLDGEWWRLVSCTFIHFGWWHLLANMYTLYILGKILEKQIGHFQFTALYFIAGIAGSLASTYWNLFVFSGGASGALFGLYGYEIILQLTQAKKTGQSFLPILINFAIYLAIVVILGEAFHFDHAAHFGGLLAGIFLAFAYKIGEGSILAKRLIPLTSLLLLTVLLQALSKDQLRYFQTFQEFVACEDETIAVFDNNYDSDQEFFEALQSSRPCWDSLSQTLKQLKEIPEPLIEDLTILIQYDSMKLKELDYMLDGVRRESYIYYDSIGVVRGALNTLPPLKYPLRMSSSAPQEEKQTESPPPGTFTTTYYDSLWVPINSAVDASYYRNGFLDSLEQWHGPVRDYFINGGIQMKGRYEHGIRDGVFIYYTKDSTYDAAGIYDDAFKTGKWEYFHDNGSIESEWRYSDRSYIISYWNESGEQLVENGNGTVKEYYANGQISSVSVYKNGLSDSISYGFYENGEPKFKEIHENGRLVKGMAITKGGEQVTYDISTYIPYPEGGMNKFYQYVAANKAFIGVKKGSGSVKLLFDVLPTGEINNIRVLKSDDGRLNKYAQRLLINGPDWVPAKLYGIEPITAEGMVEIAF